MRYWAPSKDQHALQLQVLLDNPVDLSQRYVCSSRSLPLWVCGLPSWLNARP